MTALSVVIPAWNEEDGIEDIIQRVLSIKQDLAAAKIAGMELIVVDDASTDRTAALAGSHEGVRLIRHQTNGGYGAALKTGFAAASGDLIGFLDADGTYPPEHFPALCQAAVTQQADIVIGSRMAGAESQMPRVRRLGNLIFAQLVSLISAQRVTDSASGMRVFRRDILDRLYPLPDGLNLTPVMSTRALHEHLKMIEVPIPYSERVGRSKLSVVRDGMRFGQSIVWTALHYNPMRPLGMIGLGALGLAALIGLGVILARLQGITTLGPGGVFALFAGMVLAVAGVSILALGLSFNAFVALFHQRTIRQGLFGRDMSDPDEGQTTKSDGCLLQSRRHGLHSWRLEQHFGWLGVAAGLGAILVGGAAFGLGLRGWPVDRLWFYFLASASLVLVGIQLIVAWIQMEVLQALQIRARLAGEQLDRPAHDFRNRCHPAAESRPVHEAQPEPRGVSEYV